jgi:cytochrome c oxidase subunit 2
VPATTAFAGNGGLLPLPAHSPNAHRIRDAYVFVTIFAAIIFIIVEGALLVLITRYRRGKRGRYQEGPQIHGSTRLEILWTVVPVIMLAAIGGYIFYKLPGISDAPPAAAAEQTTITVEGHQFYWLFKYPNGAITVGTMIAPAGEVVHEDITAPATDVNHSWWVPELGGKTDAIPGQTNHSWFQAPVGTYVARCAELCGIQHALMDATVKVVPRAEYEAFIAARAAAPSSLAVGKEEWLNVCSSCHRLSETYVGPALGGNPLLRDREGITNLVRHGLRQMPAVGETWTEAQIDALIAYTSTFPKQKANGFRS